MKETIFTVQTDIITEQNMHMIEIVKYMHHIRVKSSIVNSAAVVKERSVDRISPAYFALNTRRINVLGCSMENSEFLETVHLIPL